MLFLLLVHVIFMPKTWVALERNMLQKIILAYIVPMKLKKNVNARRRRHYKVKQSVYLKYLTTSGGIYTHLM